jgi:hypothetical protein
MVVSFHELAERELNETTQYYDTEQRGLGAAFIADARRCTDAIPQIRSRAQIRGRVRRRLPEVCHGVFTRSARNCAGLAAANLRRHPTYWAGRS